MKLFIPALFALSLIAQTATGQANKKLDTAAIRQLAATCAPEVAPDTIEAIAKSESAFYPYALSINYPTRAAKQYGYLNSNLYLAQQPKDRSQAILWTRWFLSHGYTVSVGLMQVNIELASSLHISPEKLFDPCTNVRTGARILQDDFANQTHDLDGMIHAFSMYNSGNPSTGIQNGYATTILKNAPRP